MINDPQKRVLIPNGYWTPYRNELFKGRLRGMEQRHAAAFYAVMYDRACHDSTRCVEATLDHFAKWSGLETADVAACLEELEGNGLVECKKKGALGNWKGSVKCTVPLTRPSLEEGGWIPVPRFIVHKYVPKYPDSIILLALLFYQNSYGKNEVFPGVGTLATVFGWSERRVSRALLTLSDSKAWKKLKTGLMRPLTQEHKIAARATRPHYHVRAVVYEQRGEYGPTVRIAKTFARKFAVPSLQR